MLLATPIYNGFYGDIRATKTVANESLMKFVNGRYEIDWAGLREQGLDARHQSLDPLQSAEPGRPRLDPEELTRYGEICLKHNVLVLADEIHCDFISKGSKYIPFSTLDNKDLVNNSITYKSVSKSFSLAGMKAAWFFTTNPEVYKATAFNNHADLNTLGMVAAEAAYAGGEGWLNDCVSYISDNHEFANDYIKKNIPMIKVGQAPEGTYLQWIDVTRDRRQDRRQEDGR